MTTMALADSYVKQEFSPEVHREDRDKQLLLEEMGITQDDTDKLRKMMLSADEATCAKNEELTSIRQHKGQRDSWWEFMNVKRCMGRVLHHSEFIRGFRQLFPRQQVIVYDGAQRGRLGLCVVRNVPAEEIPDYRGTLKHVECPIYLGWCETDWIPEFEIDYTNDAFVAVGQRRGWRTVLLNLIARKDALKRPDSLVSEERARRVFGEVSDFERGRFYRRRLWEFRNGRM
jgi:hypothetical protein